MSRFPNLLQNHGNNHSHKKETSLSDDYGISDISFIDDFENNIWIPFVQSFHRKTIPRHFAVYLHSFAKRWETWTAESLLEPRKFWKGPLILPNRIPTPIAIHHTASVTFEWAHSIHFKRYSLLLIGALCGSGLPYGAVLFRVHQNPRKHFSLWRLIRKISLNSIFSSLLALIKM